MKTSRFAALSLLFSVGGAALAVYAADVAGNWNEHCSKCHGADGKGQTKMGKKLGLRDLTDPA
ncbi:MAG: cytochrome c, partial [Verrucomicrobia bacterium]|nr:cytochrome c [Verrucomicrobiota bacterium]